MDAKKKQIENLELNRAKIELGNLKTKFIIQETKLRDLEAEHNQLYNDFLKTISSYKKLHEEHESKSEELSKLKTKIKSHWLLKMFLK